VTDWLHSLPVGWLVVVVCAFVFVIAAAVYALVIGLAGGGRLDVFTGVSPGMLPPMALVFGLVVGFLAAQVWSDAGNAQVAVNREASSLRSVVLLSSAFPAEAPRMRALVRRQIDIAVTEEWPAMAHRAATLAVVSAPLASALQLALALPAKTPGQVDAQREMVSSLQNALDARRQRIIVSESSVNWAKWAAMLALGILTLVAIAFVHSANRKTAAIAIALFAGAIAISVVMIAVQDRPFAGPFRIKPTVLEQVEPSVARP
jgi:hypothetical protein